LVVPGGSLGIIVPVLFVLTLRKGIQNGPFDDSQKSSHQKVLFSIVTLWALIVWGASLGGAIGYQVGDTIPRFLIPLFAPALIGVALLANKTVKAVVDHTPLSALAGMQAFRFAGASLFLVVYAGALPQAFVSGGYGDIVTGALALTASILLSKRASGSKLAFWGFTLAGVADLLNVLFLLLAYYPIWNHAALTSAPAADFSLVMLPAIAAPMALIMHFCGVRNFFAVKDM